MNGDKIYEYRKRFCNEPVIAYMYVSVPVKAVTGIVHLGKKTKLSDWREQYKNNRRLRERQRLIRTDYQRDKYGRPRQNVSQRYR